jgi:hypothetical protein
MASTSLTIILELDEPDTPSGSARLPGGPPRQFHGWLGLSETIDALASANATKAVASRTPASAQEGRNTA